MWYLVPTIANGANEVNPGEADCLDNRELERVLQDAHRGSGFPRSIADWVASCPVCRYDST